MTKPHIRCVRGLWHAYRQRGSLSPFMISRSLPALCAKLARKAAEKALRRSRQFPQDKNSAA